MASWTQTTTAKTIAEIEQIAPVSTSEAGVRDQWEEAHRAAVRLIKNNVLGNPALATFTVVLSGYGNDNGHEGSTKDSIIVNVTRV